MFVPMIPMLWIAFNLDNSPVNIADEVERIHTSVTM